MGRDFTPYRPRMVVELDQDNGNTFGTESRVPELESFKREMASRGVV
ncbi:hypothetical protein AB0D91_40405 [Streptomyces canus]